MCFFDFVEEDDAVWFAADFFCQFSTIAIADVTGGCADDLSNAVTFHEFAHVEADECRSISEEFFSEKFSGERFTNACRTEEKE